MNLRRFCAAAACALAVAAVAVPAAFADSGGDGAKDNDTHVQLLGFNDFHGHIESHTPRGIQTGQFRRSNGSLASVFTPAGGAEYFSTHVKQLRTQNTNTIVVGSGDLIGASPLTSAIFHDEPTIEAMNLIGLDVSGVGNHEFDEGLGELYRLMSGGCHPVDGCADGDPYFGSVWGYLAANVYFKGTEETVLPQYEIRKIDNAKIAFIGLTLEGTPQIVTASAVEGLQFRDEIETVNALVHELRHEHGVRAFVVLLHQGGFQNPPWSNADPANNLPGWPGINNCDNMSQEIVPIAHGLDDQVDVIVSGHTHAQYICAGDKEIDGKLVTSAASFGRLITDIDLVIDHESKDVKAKTARNVIVTQDVEKDPELTALVEKYRAAAAPFANRIIGTISADITRTPNAAGEFAAGLLIGDAQLWATTPTDFGGAQIALMNPGGVRADFDYEMKSGVEEEGEVTYGEAFSVQPFGNVLVTKTYTGEQIQRLLEQQFTRAGGVRILQPSWTLTYSYDTRREKGDFVVDESVYVGDEPLQADREYRVTMNSFLADGGDGFTVFGEGTNALTGEIDLDALVRYFQEKSPLSAPAFGRITKLG